MVRRNFLMKKRKERKFGNLNFVVHVHKTNALKKQIFFGLKSTSKSLHPEKTRYT